jgi:galactose mutarotase-like enzyme
MRHYSTYFNNYLFIVNEGIYCNYVAYYTRQGGKTGMFKVTEFVDKFNMYKLENPDTNTFITVCPERGGIITEFGAKGKNVLYLDKSTFYNVEANIRGGIPILFPICGQLANGQYQLNGTTYQLRNHGLARNNPWSVKSTYTDENSASITLSLSSNTEMEKSFPFAFELVFTYLLKGDKLYINQEYHNHSDVEMPFYAGFHPYFNTSQKTRSYETDATKYIDYNDMQTKTFTGKLNLDPMVESAILLDAKRPEIAFVLPELQTKVHMEYGDEFKYVVLWSVHNKDFVCVEPWMARNDEFNRKQELTSVQPGQALHTKVVIYTV